MVKLESNGFVINQKFYVFAVKYDHKISRVGQHLCNQFESLKIKQVNTVD